MIEQYDFIVSLKHFFENKLGLPCDIIADGYKMRDEKPFMTVEQMQNNYEYNVKGREAVEAIYRAQVGLHAGNAVEKMRIQESVQNALIFEKIPYRKAGENVGFFSVEVMAVMPMPSGDITNHSGRHTVYFDVELSTYKRGGN